MNWILGFVIFLILLFILNSNRNKKKRLKTIQDLKDNWGKRKKNEIFHFELIEKYFINTKLKSNSFHIISNRCANDLDLNDVFKVIDRTTSKIGQQYLYYKLRSIQDEHKLSSFSSLTTLFLENEKLRLRTQYQLSQINSHSSYNFEELINSDPIQKPKIIWLIYTLSFLSFLTIIFGLFFPVFYLFLLPIVTLNMVFHYKNKWNVSGYLDGVVQLSKVLHTAKAISKYSEIKLKFPNITFIKSVEEINFKTKFISFEKNLENEFASIFWLLFEFIKILFNIEYVVFYSFIDSIRDKREDLRKMFHFIGEIDAAISTASLKASELNSCTPTFTKDKEILVEEINHPLIDNCVSNNLHLKNSSLLLTGSNMSGKTTFIRSIAINSILSQTLNICFAKKYQAPYLKLYSSIRIADDLLENTSYYLEEVLTIKNLINSSLDNHPCLFVLDEIFKGTNTIERISGGKAILSYLNKGNNIVLVSTHDIELADLLEKQEFTLHHFSEHIVDDKLTFDYKLTRGKLKSRNAIKILDIYNYPSEIIIDAKETERTFKM